MGSDRRHTPDPGSGLEFKVMTYDPEKHHRRSIRLPGYDYSAAGAYFITMCTRNRNPLFGKIVNGEMRLNEMGIAVENIWRNLSNEFPWITLDTAVVMPDHFHAIFWIRNAVPVENAYKRGGKGEWDSPLQIPHGTSKTVGSVVRGFKIRVTQWARRNTDIQTVWHRDYWETVIREEQSLYRIRQYILENPVKWQRKQENKKDGQKGRP